MSHFYLIDSQQAVFNGGGKSLKIRPQSYEVFSILLDAQDTIVSKEHLLENVWESVTVTDGSVTQCIADIRRILGGQHRNLLQTIPKKGYRLSAGISDSGSPILIKVPSPPSQPQPIETSKRTGIKLRTIAITVFILSPAALLFLYGQVAVNKELPDGLQSIAVLPFKNLSGLPTDDYLSEGTTEDLITDLSTLSGLRVTARNSVFVYKDKNIDPSIIAKKLNVRYILSGSIRRSGEKLRINVELTDNDVSKQLWADRFSGELSNLFDLQDRISQSVMDALELKLTVREKERLKIKATENLEAYSLYQQGRSHTFSNQRELGQEYLRKAINLDPAFSNAYAALAVSHAIAVSFGQSADMDEELDKAFRLATKAVSIDRHSAEAHVALAQTFLLRGMHEESIRSAKQAVESNPSYAPALIMHGWAHALSGEYDTALDSLSRAVVLQPASNGMVLTVQGSTYYFAGRYHEAETILEESISLNPNVLTSRIFLAATYQHLKKYDNAEWEALETMALNPQFTITQWRWAQIFKNKSTPEYQRLLQDLQAAGLPLN